MIQSIKVKRQEKREENEKNQVCLLPESVSTWKVLPIGKPSRYQRLQMSDLICQLHMSDLICQLHMSDLICQLHMSDLICQLHMSDLICQLHMSDLICQLLFDTCAYSLNLQTTDIGGVHIEDLRSKFRDSVFRFNNFPHCYAISAEGSRGDQYLNIDMIDNDDGTAFLDLVTQEPKNI